MSNRINLGFVLALVRRDLRKYFTNPTGYVFITLFIFLGAAAAFWQDRFFLNNLANLDLLNEFFPYLLLFFIPALTMSVWSEEKKQGTDELLLTLPATSLEVVLGKFVATIGIYTASLLLSISHVLVLFWLGGPDLGQMFGSYLAYWLIGVSLIAVGMMASLLTSNPTIAFILGAAFCSLVVFIDLAGVLGEGFRDLVSPLGVVGHFGELASGVISFSGLCYFASLTGLALYGNVLLVEKRHWPRMADGFPMWVHQVTRVIALGVMVICVNVALSRWVAARLDATAERLHSLDASTLQLLEELTEERPVFIQAYLSPEVPEQYVQTRENVLSILREIDSEAGARVEVLVESTEPYTEQAREAREKFGITPHQIPNLGSARSGFSDVYLGLAFTCGAEEQVLPFLDRGLPVEYEITRSIRVVARTVRKRIGVLNTEAKLFGGFDFQSMRSSPAWSVVDELKKQYEVVQISPAAPVLEEVDGLVVALPSSLSQEEMDNVLAVIESGKPALLLVDPLPIIDIGLAPSETAGANMNPFLRSQGPPPKEKGDIRGFLHRLGVAWDPSSVVWDNYNPHPDLAHLPPEVVFLGAGNENPQTFNQNQPASSGLQEIVFLYPGHIEKASGTSLDFEPVLQSGAVSGRLSYFQMVQRNFFGAQMNRNLPHRPDGESYTLAAWVRGGLPGSEAGPTGDASQNGQSQNPDGDAESGSVERPSDGQNTVNVMIIADLDFISEQFFQIRARGPENLNFDNVTFFLNCIDVLVGDDSFVALRKKRVRHRTLARVEEQTRNFVQERLSEEQAAETDAERALEEAQRRLQERVDVVRQRPDLDAQTKQIMARNLQEVENRRFEVLKANIEAEKETRINASKENMEAQVRRIQSSIRSLAVLLPPIPVFVLGVLIFLRRQRREREGAAAARRLRT